MAIDVTFLGHACLKLTINEQVVLVDPFLAPDNPVATVTANDVTPDYILVTHGHGDHVGQTVALAQRTGAPVITLVEVGAWLQRQGAPKVHAQNIGGGYRHPFGYVRLTQAWHTSSMPDGSYGGTPAGLLIEADSKRLYIAGDTALFGDMALIAEGGLDLAVLPIGDNYTMGPSEALRAVGLLQPRKVLPYHYNTWPLIAQDGARWAAGVRALDLNVEPVVLQPGETLTLV